MILFRGNIKALEKIRRTLVMRVDHDTQIRLCVVNRVELSRAIGYVEEAIRSLKLIE